MLLLYNPVATSRRQATVPMSLLALGSALEGRREYAIADGHFHDDPAAELLRLLREQPVSALGMTVMAGPQLVHAVPLVRRVKQAFPDLPIIWGGYFPTQHYETALASGYVDYVVHGQGEQTLLELLEALDRGGAVAGIAGLSYRDRTAIRRTPPRAIQPTGQFGPLPYHRVPLERYIHRNYVGTRSIAYNSSYGCPFACSFCAVVEMSNRRWMPESPERTADTLRHLRDRYGVNAVQFVDMDFFVSEPRVAELAERIGALGMHWWALGRIDELSRYADATWRTMRDSGLRMVFCGVESGSDETLQRMNKGGTAAPAMALELAARMKAYDIVPEYSFVLGAPPDPDADFARTVALIREVKRINPRTEIILYGYTPVVHAADRAELGAQLRQAGFTFPARLEEWAQPPWSEFALRRAPATPWSDPTLYRRIRDFERVLNARFPTVTDPRLTRPRRALLRAASGWRYRLGVYAHPLELRALLKLCAYRRPETIGY